MSVDKTINITERAAAPDTPATGDWRLYFKSGGLYIIDDAGAETLLGAAGGGGADTALSNLAAVAINTSLISDTDSTDDLGSTSVYWRNAYLDTAYFTEQAAPATPATDKVVIYPKADGLMYSKDDAGVETLMSSGVGGGGVTDAADLTYTPAVVGDWTGAADPGDTDNALDQLAARVTDAEADIVSHTHTVSEITDAGDLAALDTVTNAHLATSVITGLTADATPDSAADYVMTYDASATALKKVLLEDLPSGGGGATGGATVWLTHTNGAGKPTVGVTGSGNWITVPLTGVNTDPSSLISVASNQVNINNTGDYLFLNANISVVSASVNTILRWRIRNVTSGVTVAQSTDSSSNTSALAAGLYFYNIPASPFSAAANDKIELQVAGITTSTITFGPVNGAADGIAIDIMMAFERIG